MATPTSAYEAYENRLRILRIILTWAGYIFMVAVIVALNLYTFEHSPHNRAYPFYQLAALVTELIITFAAVRAVRFTLQTERTRRAVTISILYGLVALFIIAIIAYLQGQVAVFERDIRSLDRRLDIALAILKRNDLLNQYDEQVGVTGPIPMELLGTITTFVTAITGLIAAIAGIYIQILSARKAQTELDIEKMKLARELEQEIPLPKPKRTTSKKTNPNKGKGSRR